MADAGERGEGNVVGGASALVAGFRDPDSGVVAIGYVTSQMGPRWQHPRNRALLDAVYASLG